MLIMFERSEYATQFHQTYYLMLVREIFAVMTGKHITHSHVEPRLGYSSMLMMSLVMTFGILRSRVACNMYSWHQFLISLESASAATFSHLRWQLKPIGRSCSRGGLPCPGG